MVDLSTEDWRRVLETNLTAAFQVGREAARRMIARGRGGKIINIGSLTSALARATVAPYTAAEGGIKMLTQSMAAEWAGHDIQANAIGPEYILTEMNRALIDDAKFDAWVRGRTPSGRWGQPDDLIGAAVFLRFARFVLCQRANHLCRRRPARRHVRSARRSGASESKLEIAMRGVIIYALRICASKRRRAKRSDRGTCGCLFKWAASADRTFTTSITAAPDLFVFAN